jgi:hypothetical protein
LTVYPRYATKTIFKDAFKGGRYVVHAEKEYSEIAAKFVGDLSKENLARGFDWLSENIAAPKGLNAHLASAAAAGDLGSFRTNLIVALNDASKGITKQLDDMYDNINNFGNDNPKLGIFGDLVLREVRRQRPRPSDMSNDGADLMELQSGKQFIIKMFDDLQYNLARNWFYYGNDPRPGGIHHARFNLELQFWALFVLKTNWKFTAAAAGKYADTKTDYQSDDDSAITLSRVAEAIRGVAGQEIIDNFYATKPPINPLTGRKGTIQEIDVDEEQSKSNISDAVQAAGRDDGQERPKDLSKIQDWARAVERLSFRMEMAGSPRQIESVGKMHVAAID